MNDTAIQASPITLDRRLVLGEIDYQVTAFPTEDRRIELCIVSSDGDGRVISEISGGIAPADLAGLTDVLTSTLAGLIAMTQPPPTRRAAPAPAHPRQGARWSARDDERLVARCRQGVRLRDLVEEFGRSPDGIRARLELLGEIEPVGARRGVAPVPVDGGAAGAAPPIGGRAAGDASAG